MGQHHHLGKLGAVFAALSVLCLVLFIVSGKTPVLALCASVTAFAIQFRPESVLVLLVLGYFLLIGRPQEFRRARIYYSMGFFLVLSWTHWIHLFGVMNHGWGSVTDEKIAIGHFANNFKTNAGYYFFNQKFPLLITAAALLSFASVKSIKRSSAFLVWFAVMWGFFLTYYAGSYEVGADMRFAVLSFAPIALLAGKGFGVAKETLSLVKFPSPSLLVSAVFLWSAVQFLPEARKIGMESREARADVEFCDEAISEIPIDGIVYSHVPTIFSVRGRSAAQLELFTPESDFASMEDEYAGGIYMHWGYWCMVGDPLLTSHARRILDAFDCVEVASSQMRSYRYILYRVYPKRPGEESEEEYKFGAPRKVPRQETRGSILPDGSQL